MNEFQLSTTLPINCVALLLETERGKIDGRRRKGEGGYLFASSSGVCMFHGIKLDKGVDSNVAERRFKEGEDK